MAAPITYRYPDSLPTDWHGDVSASLQAAEGYQTYFSLSLGSSGDSNYCTQVDLDTWAIGWFNDVKNPSWELGHSGSLALTDWLSASGSTDISAFSIVTIPD